MIYYILYISFIYYSFSMYITTTIKKIPQTVLNLWESVDFDFEKDVDKLEDWLENMMDLVYVQKLKTQKNKEYRDETVLDSILD